MTFLPSLTRELSGRDAADELCEAGCKEKKNLERGAQEQGTELLQKIAPKKKKEKTFKDVLEIQG